ncbi:MAG: TonB-dependent receptor, partial [Bacteroidota bacterium]
DESREETSNNWGTLAIISEREKGSSELNLGYRVSTDFFEFNPLFTPNEHEMTQQFANFKNSFELGQRSTFVLGLQYVNKEVESTDRGNHENTSLAAYGILTHSFDNGLFANASLRAENDDNFGTEVLPQVSLSYIKENWVFRTSYGKSIRAADFTERYVSFLIPNLSPGRNAGNPDLEAERSNSFDLGADYKNKGLDFSITGFYRASTNLIDFALTNQLDIPNLTNLQDSADYLYARNITESDVLGLELTVGLKDYTINSNLKGALRLNYTYLETSGETGELSKYISNHPVHNFSFLFDLAFQETLGLNLNGNYLTRQEEIVESIQGEIPASYFLMNTKVYWNITPDISVYGKVLNTLDTQYQEILGAQAPGRWWLLGVNWNFKK